MHRIHLIPVVSALLVAGLVAPTAVRGDIAVEPFSPWIGAAVTVIVLPNGDPACQLWTVSARTGFTITLEASPPPPFLGCLPGGQAIDLGTLPVAGRYHVEARRQDGTVWGEVFFPVTETPAPRSADEALIRPARPTTADSIDVVLSLGEFPPCFSLLGVHDIAVAGDTVTITVAEADIGFECPPSPIRQHGFLAHLPALTAGLKHLVVSFPTFNPALSRNFTVEPASDSVLLADRFEAHLSWTDPDGTVRQARPERLSEASAVYSFADRANVELTVKALDGRPVNGKFWIFAASLTDQPWELRVIDRGSANCSLGHCDERTYKGIAHQNANVLDTEAFQDCPVCAP